VAAVLLGSDPGDTKSKTPPCLSKKRRDKDGAPARQRRFSGRRSRLDRDDGHHEKEIEAEGPEDYEFGAF
jgi:hypothetical protein